VRYFFLIIIILNSIYSFAEKNDTIIKIDTTFIKETKNLLSTQLYLSNSSNNFNIKSYNINKTLNYTPNINGNIGFGFAYKWIGASISIGLKNNEIEKKGKTDKFDIGFTMFGQKNIIDAKLQLFNGFYIANPWIYDTNFTDTLNYPKRKDITTNSARISWVYSFNNKKFSNKAAFAQSEIQLKSVGSFLLGAFANANIISADSSVLPIQARNQFSPESNFNTTGNLSFTFGGGYAYSFIVKHFFLTLSLIQGLGMQWIIMIYDNEQLNEVRKSLATHTQIRLCIGYNSYRNYFGINAFGDISPFELTKENKTEVNFNSNYIKIYYGHRFNFNMFKKKQ